ncbi:MAG: hypothetical protein ACOYEP_04520 [Limnochordia bacterium]
MKKRIFFLVLVFLLSLSGCSLRLPVIPKVRNVEVTAVVKSKPLNIGGQNSTSVSTDSFDVEEGKRIDPASGELIDGGEEDSVLSYRVDGVPVPSNLTDAVDLAVEAVYFKAQMPQGVEGGSAVITLSAPGGETVVLVTTVGDGENRIDITDSDREILSEMLKDGAALDVEILLDGDLTGMTLSDVRVQAKAIYNQDT